MLTTLLLNADSAKDVSLAAQLLKEGKLVAVPTETVYGLAADARNAQAVSHIFSAKGRPADHPLIVHLHAASALTDWAKDIPQSAHRLAEAFWPGPLTLLLKKADHVDSCVTGGLDSIGLRVPAHPVLLQVLQSQQLAVAAPSANLYKRLSPTSARHVIDNMTGKIDAVLDGGECEFGLESTIVSLLGDDVQVLRAGPISAWQLEQALGAPVYSPESHQVKVSGNQDAHYQPNTKLTCLTTNELAQLCQTTALKLAILSLHTEHASHGAYWEYRMPDDAVQYGRELYKQLSLADQSGADMIIVERPPTDSNWLAVQNRLMRAAYHPE